MRPEITSSIERAASLLREAGATSVYLFGSASDPGPRREPRDIDLAVEGLPRDRFYRVVGRLLWELPIAIDVVDLGSDTFFVRRLRESGRLRRVA